MTRPLSKFANFVSVNIFHMRQIAITMNDEQFGAWCRKAIIDMSAGCINDDVDPIVKAAYDDAYSAMVNEQERKRASYERRKKNPSTSNAVAPVGAKKRNDQLIWGRFENVFLSQDEYNTLATDFGNVNFLNQTIDQFSASLADGKVDSRNHFATLTRWIAWRKQKAESEQNQPKYETVSEHNRRVVEQGKEFTRILKEQGLIG